MAVTRTLPRLDADNRAFWTGGADGELRIMHCMDCDAFIHPPRPVCNNCLSENVAPEVVKGTGIVDTYTVNYQKWSATMEVPCVIARISIDGAPGVILTSNIVGCPVEAVDIGDRVSVVFEQQDDIYLPFFEKLD